MHECNKEDTLDYIQGDIAEIKGDVKSLLQFKWQIMGGAGVVGVILAFIMKALIK